jgi:hypothetical protein
MSVALLHLVPPLLLLVVLLLQRYPGDRRLVALAEARSIRRHHQAAPSAPRARPRGLVPRGGLLIGSALAVRPPPRACMAA